MNTATEHSKWADFPEKLKMQTADWKSAVSLMAPHAGRYSNLFRLAVGEKLISSWQPFTRTPNTFRRPPRLIFITGTYLFHDVTREMRMIARGLF